MADLEGGLGALLELPSGTQLHGEIHEITGKM